jgi:predicted small metal-binding protein
LAGRSTGNIVSICEIRIWVYFTEDAMAQIYFISCRDAGVDCDFEARASSMDEVMQLCADHGIREHNMKGFGPDLYLKMKRCVKVLEETSNS